MRLNSKNLQSVAVIAAALVFVVNAADLTVIQKAREATQRRVSELESGKASEEEAGFIAKDWRPVRWPQVGAPQSSSSAGKRAKIDPAILESARQATAKRVAELDPTVLKTECVVKPQVEEGPKAITTPASEEALARARQITAERVKAYEEAPFVVSRPASVQADSSMLAKAVEATKRRVAEVEWAGKVIRPTYVAESAKIEQARKECMQRVDQIEFGDVVKPRFVADPAAVEKARAASRARVEEVEFGPSRQVSVNPVLIETARRATRQRLVELDPFLNPDVPQPSFSMNPEQLTKARQQTEEAVRRIETKGKPLIQDTRKIKAAEIKRVEERAKKEAQAARSQITPKSREVEAKKASSSAPVKKVQAESQKVQAKPAVAKPEPENRAAVEKPVVSKPEVKVQEKQAPKQVKPVEEKPTVTRAPVPSETRRATVQRPVVQEAQPKAQPAPVAPKQPAVVVKPETQKREDAEKAATRQAQRQSRAESPTPETAKPTARPSATVDVPPPPIPPEKKRKLDELLEKYMTDKITPEEYHRERARILAEP